MTRGSARLSRATASFTVCWEAGEAGDRPSVSCLFSGTQRQCRPAGDSQKGPGHWGSNPSTFSYQLRRLPLPLSVSVSLSIKWGQLGDIKIT